MRIRWLSAELLPAALQRLPGMPRLAVPATKPPGEKPDEVINFAALLDRLGYLPKADRELVREAYKFADEAHLGQYKA